MSQQFKIPWLILQVYGTISVSFDVNLSEIELKILIFHSSFVIIMTKFYL